MTFFLIASSSSSLVGELWVSISAMVGGIIVFVGLLLEKIAVVKSERHHPTFRKSHKGMEEWGWYSLMFGIFVEVVVAGWSAARDDLAIKEAAAEAVKNDPRKQLISLASATAEILVRGNPKMIFAETDLSWIAEATFLRATNANLLMGDTPRLIMRCTNFRHALGGGGTKLWIEFNKEQLDDFLIPKGPIGPMQDWNEAFIMLPYQDGVEILNGTITLTLNTSSKTFSIPTQLYEFGRGGLQVFEGTNATTR